MVYLFIIYLQVVVRGNISFLCLVSACSLKDFSCPWRCWSKLTLNLLTTTIVAPPSNASKLQMGFNSAFKGLKTNVQE